MAGSKGVGNSLLYDQANHISEAISHGHDFGTFRCIPMNPDRAVWVLNENQKGYVRQAGLHHLAEMEHIRIDHALITALVERWRPETNTFHFPSGEATVTLEDVTYIYGLPIDGPIVTGRTFPSSMVSEVCLQLLGKAPIQGPDVNGINIKFTWLEDNFAAVPSKKTSKTNKKKLSKADEIYNTRAYLFFLVSSQIMSNTSGGRGPAYLLEFREFKPYAWAPACLANLYWILAKAVKCVKDKAEDGHQEGDECKSSNKSDDFRKFRTLTGPLQLLQLWAYTRMQIGRCPPPNDTWKSDIQFPLMKTWTVRLNSFKVVTTLTKTRQQLNKLPQDGFKWQPYNKLGKKFRHNVSKADRDQFSSSTVLAFYWVVERHNTGRVMKQFGFHQEVPPPFSMPFARVERVEKIVYDYSVEGRVPNYVLWDSRSQCALKGKKASSKTHTEDYMHWYRANTIMYIGRVQAHEQIDTTKTKRDEHEGYCEQKHVHQLLLHMERSVDRAVRKKTSIEHFRDSWIRKIFRFRSGLNTKFGKFKDDYLNSSGSEDDKKASTEFKRVKKAAGKSPGKKTGKKQKSVKYNSDVPGSHMLHTPIE